LSFREALYGEVCRLPSDGRIKRRDEGRTVAIGKVLKIVE